MYVPRHFAMDDSAVRDLLTHHGAADLVTQTERGLVATMLPFVFDEAAGDHGSLLGHVARNNEQWQLEPLGEAHEAGLGQPWSVDDAPRAFVDGHLRAIVGIEVQVTRIEAKAKASQNRSAADIDGVVAGLRAAGSAAAEDARRFRR